MTEFVASAVRNNARWCDAVCRSHGLETVWQAGYWRCLGTPPPYYPACITLTRETGSLPEIRPGFAIKDSFDRLAPDDDQWTPLIRGHWYCSEPGGRRLWQGAARRVRDTAELAGWLEAWGGTPDGAVVFPKRLLEDGSVYLLTSKDDSGGLAAYVEGGGEQTVIGITNLFGAEAGIAACLSHLAAHHPGSLITGYGDAAEIEVVSHLGFRQGGALSVWLKRAAKKGAG